MRKHIAALFIITCALSARSASEDTDTTARVLKEVQVTTSKASRPAVSTAPMIRVDHSQMLRSGVTDVSDALHRMPGVNLRDYGGAGGLKTVSVRGFGAGHTGVFYDGVPLGDAQTGQIDLSRYSVDNVQDISLVIGDNDDIFIPARMAASAATVSISSMSAPDHKEIEAKLRAGSFGYINPYLKAGIPLSEDAYMNFVGDFTHADNDYPFKLRNGNLTTTETRTNSRMNSGHAEVNAMWRSDNRNIFQAKAYYYGSSRQLPGPVIYYNNTNNEHLREQNAMVQAQWRSNLATGLSLKGLIKYNFASSFYSDVDGKYPTGKIEQNYWQREFYTSWALLYAASGRLMFDYSADYFHNDLNSNLRSDRRPYRNSLLQSATAKFRTNRLTVTCRALLSVYLNGASRGEAAKNAARISPSLSLSWQPVSDRLLYLRASYKNIFRMPTFNEAYFDHFGSTDVLPESTDQINLGTTYTLRSGSRIPQAVFSADCYMNNVRDMIVAVPYNMFVWSMVNLGKVRTFGVDATATVTFSPAKTHDITLSANYSYQRAMPRTDPQSSDWMKQVAYIPRHSGSVSLGYENPWVNLSVNTTGVSARYTTNNNLPATRIPGYVEVGATVWRDFSLKKHNLQLRLDILNILDKQYCIVARYPMPGRSFKASLTWKF